MPKLPDRQIHANLKIIRLATEQKIAKLIWLVEELRTDLPSVKNREDTEAEVMKQATDPHVILELLQNKSENPSTLSPEHKNHGN
jgi:uncharacterized membrane protein